MWSDHIRWKQKEMRAGRAQSDRPISAEIRDGIRLTPITSQTHIWLRVSAAGKENTSDITSLLFFKFILFLFYFTNVIIEQSHNPSKYSLTNSQENTWKGAVNMSSNDYEAHPVVKKNKTSGINHTFLLRVTIFKSSARIFMTRLW